jgi:transcriptional regulator with XRE-family HTH domain
MAKETTTGTRIAKRRQVLGLTQQELADRIGVDRVTVANWEINKHFPQRYLGKVEDVLGITIPVPEPEAATA